MSSKIISRSSLRWVLPGLLSSLPGFLLVAGVCSAETWSGTLQGGSKLEVDPRSRRAVTYKNGAAVQMWDGTHRLDDGSVVIIRDGKTVPTEAMMDTWAASPPVRPALAGRHCDQLERKVCGYDNACSFDESCVRARQLLRDEREEQRRMPLQSGMHPTTGSSGKCKQALTDPALPSCNQGAAVKKDSPCDLLVLRVCGGGDVCAGAQSCTLARQLLEMETDERLVGSDPNAPTATGGQCREAMTNDFFKPCKAN